MKNQKQTNSLEGKLVNMEGNPAKESKFIVCTTENPNQLEFYCANIGVHDLHKKIAEANDIPASRVVGGGYFILEDRVLTVNKDSKDFGPVPKEIAEDLANILVEYIAKEYNQKVEKVNVNVGSNFHKAEQKKYWMKNGFSALDTPQIIHEIIMLYLPADIDTQGLNIMLEKDKKKFVDYLGQLPKYESKVKRAWELASNFFLICDPDVPNAMEKMHQIMAYLDQKDESKLTSKVLASFHEEYCKLAKALDKLKENLK